MDSLHDMGSMAAIGRGEALLRRLVPGPQRRALQVWLRLCSESEEPGAIKPEAFGASLHYACLLRVFEDDHGALDFTHVIEGREVLRYLGAAKGAPFSKVYAWPYRCAVEPLYQAAMISGAPARGLYMTESIEGEPLGFSQLVLPFSGKDPAQQRLLTVFEFDQPPEKAPMAPLEMHTPWRRLNGGREKRVLLGDRRAARFS